MSLRTLWLAAGTVFVLGGGVSAQEPGPRAAERLRREFETRFAQQVRTQLGLTEEQAVRVNQILSQYAARRRQLEMEEQTHRVMLGRELRPGIAANHDSVSRAVDRIAEVRVLYMQAMQEELRELGTILDPVQRAQFFMLRDRVLQRAQELREQRVRAGRPPMGDPPRPPS